MNIIHAGNLIDQATPTESEACDSVERVCFRDVCVCVSVCVEGQSNAWGCFDLRTQNKRDNVRDEVYLCSLPGQCYSRVEVQMCGSARYEREDLVSWSSVSKKVDMANLPNGSIRSHAARVSELILAQKYGLPKKI